MLFIAFTVCLSANVQKSKPNQEKYKLFRSARLRFELNDPPFLVFYNQPGMHVNGAPQMMQPPNMGVVPGPMAVPGPGQGPVPVGPPGNHHTA